MIAVVLSGGGNFGAMQAGALEVLIEQLGRAELFIGTSAGAINAIHMAADPTLDGARSLSSFWREVTSADVGRLSTLGGLARFIRRRPGLIPSEPLAGFLRRRLPAHVETFEELAEMSGTRAFALATQLETGELRVFGDLPDDRLLDGAMASTAIPPYLPPWVVDGKRYVDGAVHSNLPLREAVTRGARQIFAVYLESNPRAPLNNRGLFTPGSRALTLMVRNQVRHEIEWARDAGLEVRLLRLPTPADIAYWDYSHADRLIEAGREHAQRQLSLLSESEPSDWWRRLRRRLTGPFRAPRGVRRVREHA